MNAVGYTTKGQAPRPAEDGADRRHRRPRRNGGDERRLGRHPHDQHARAPRASSPSRPKAQEVLARPSRTAAISKHTNAFKLTRDVVIPLPRMGDYCDGIERINIELSTQNKLALCDDALPNSCRANCRCMPATPNRQGRADRRPPPGRARLCDQRPPPLAVAARQPRPAAGRAEKQFAGYGVAAGELSNRAANPDALPPPAGTTPSAPRGRRN